MPKSTYYYEISKVDTVDFRNIKLTEEIKKIFSQHKGRYGVRRVYRELLRRGNSVNHKRVQRIMHSLGLQGKRPKEKYHSFKGEVGKVAPNIIDRDFTATAPLQKWTTDVYQFNFSWGKCYLSPIIDMYTNEVISYDLSMSPNLNQIKRMLEMAFKKFKSLTGLIFHSDQGWQYQHNYYRQELKNRGIIQSMSRRGNCIDNCIMETFFGRLKNEMYYTEHDLMRFLFKLDDSTEVKIRPVILNDEDPEYTTTGIYFGSEAILRIRNMLEQWQEMKEKYENNEITKEALQDWKANYPDNLKKDYVPFEESNVKFYKSGISAKIPPDIK